jgi:hypothetical protein
MEKAVIRIRANPAGLAGEDRIIVETNKSLFYMSAFDVIQYLLDNIIG